MLEDQFILLEHVLDLIFQIYRDCNPAILGDICQSLDASLDSVSLFRSQPMAIAQAENRLKNSNEYWLVGLDKQERFID